MFSNNEVSSKLKRDNENFNSFREREDNEIIDEELNEEDEYIENIKTHLAVLLDKFEFLENMKEEFNNKTKVFVYEETEEAIHQLYNEK